MIPDDVTIQVLTQSRPELIERTFEALPRRQARHRPSLQLDLDPAAPRRVRHRLRRHHRHRGVGRQAGQADGRRRSRRPNGCFEYSPESFTGTELEFARDICAAVGDVFEPTPQKKMIINLPATVEMSSANVYADQIEWCHRNFKYRDSMILQPASAQRPRHRRGGGRARLHGRRRPHRGLPVRQRRAHRQRRPGDPGPQHVHPGRRSRDRLLEHQRDPPDGRVLQPAAGASAPSLWRRPGVHRLLGLAPGRHQQGLQGARGVEQQGLGSALPADRPGRSRPQLRGDHPHQQPVGQGRHRLHPEERLRHRHAAPAAGRVLQA